MNKPIPREQKFQKISKLGFFSGPTAFLFCLNEVMKWETVKTLN